MTALDNLKHTIISMNEHFVERSEEIEGIAIASIAGANCLLLGEPGVAKSDLAYTWAQHIDGARYFPYLITKFTVPDELAGTLSIAKMQKEIYSRNTSNMLPEAHYSFLDEIFKGNSGTLNFLLTLINEKIFYNEGKKLPVPLISMIGASNELPENSDGLDALLDRLVIKFIVKRIQEPKNLVKMLQSPKDKIVTPTISLSDLKELQKKVDSVTFSSKMIDLNVTIVQTLIKEGIAPSDRTVKNCVQILKAHALLHNREEVKESDFEFLKNCYWTVPETKTALFSKILHIINPKKNKILDLYDEAKELTDKFLKLNTNSKKSNQAFETLSKVKDLKTEVVTLMETAKNNAEDIVEIENVIKDIDKLMHSIYASSGIDI